MAKIRLVSDATWRKFETKRHEVNMAEEEYLCFLMDGSKSDERVGDLKRQMEDSVNAAGLATSKAQKLKQDNKKLAQALTEMTERLSLSETKINELELECDQYQSMIDEQKSHILKQEDTLKDAAEKIADLTQQLVDAKTEDISLDEVEDILKDE